jgi:hypothetical protein
MDVNSDEVVGLLGLPEVGGQWRSIIGMAICDHSCEGVLCLVEMRIGCLILTSGKQWLAWRGGGCSSEGSDSAINVEVSLESVEGLIPVFLHQSYIYISRIYGYSICFW